jgi:cyclophilin family peptidyl-prolyl cis-trans isomerase
VPSISHVLTDVLLVQGHHTIKGTRIHKVQGPHFAVFGGLSDKASAESFIAASHSPFQHADPGLLSVHEDGSHFALTLGRALLLDDSYRVIGRVGTGFDVLQKLGTVETSIHDDPVVPVNIIQSGSSDYKGTGEVFGAVLNTRENDAADTKKQIQEASVGAKEALQDGLKRSRQEVAVDKTVAGAPVRKKRVMGELSSDDDEEEEEED